MDLQVETRRAETHWPVFSDVALSMLLVFALFILAQFLYYDKLFVIEEIARRQQEVEVLVMNRLPTEYVGIVEIDRLDSYRQRITFKSDSLFASCRTQLKGTGRDLIRAVSSILSERVEYFQAIQIEGHTDVRRPAGPPACPVRDNWELSSRRATVVLRLFAEQPVPPALLSAVGRGQYHPVDGAVGTTDEDFARNRRIEVVLQYTEDGIRDEAAP